MEGRHVGLDFYDLLIEAQSRSSTDASELSPLLNLLKPSLTHLVFSPKILDQPYRFRTQRQLRAYSGLALRTHGSAEYRYRRGQLERSKKQVTVRDLNENHDHDLKNVFKSAATQARQRADPLQDCSDYFDPLEERSRFRRRTNKSASGLSVLGRGSVLILRDHPAVLAGS
jgi:hypothetical protein